MHDGVDSGLLKGIYDRIAGHYDRQHGFLTAGSDQLGRRMVVEKTVKPGDFILDCGAGTGSTALLAAEKAGPAGKLVLFDISEGMLAMAKDKFSNVRGRVEFQTGDILDLP
ncbi:MAG TPA: methyltransferase domain-containing protein, partial [Sphingomonadales bacterium]|nr:methyltransferase domain-containing protein [Sphingomonadales bacterium]